MKKISLYLEPEVDRALARLAAGRSITKAELIRRTLSESVTAAGRPRPAASGVFAGPADLGAATDRYLADSGFGER
ncbi:MAG: hypothetical protein H0V29_00255 [Thermoleophilaceae bacterium]|nr:hypothetical protein [Thermoleophilaceae bacterium]